MHYKKHLAAISFLLAFNWSFGQNIGIGTVSPRARLHVVDSNVVFSAPGLSSVVTGNPPLQGPGRRMMWYADKAAFRAGVAFDKNWDMDSIGNNSFASGYGTKAKGDYSTAMGKFSEATGYSATAIGLTSTANGEGAVALGYVTRASGYGSTAIGYYTIASGNQATALGNETQASGLASIASGYLTSASGPYSSAMGYNSTAVGNSSVAIGYSADAIADYSSAFGTFTTASGAYSTAMGYSATSSGIHSVAIGREATASGHFSFAAGTKISTNGHAGAFFFGDSDPNNKGVRPIGFNDQIAMRFNGGYYFISGDAGSDIGVRVLAGGNSWSAISDARLKEKVLPVDGETILQKISKLKLSTWNYIGQDAKNFRHYGPMAQDFYAAFGRDALGTIGCDTLINQQDFLGVNLIAVQALEKRTADQQKEIDELKACIRKLEALLKSGK